jgi:hypothetical protein
VERASAGLPFLRSITISQSVVGFGALAEEAYENDNRPKGFWALYEEQTILAGKGILKTSS